jgi:hypothetical protein
MSKQPDDWQRSEAGRARFVAFTFGDYLRLLEEFDGSFDSDAPGADLSTADFTMVLANDTDEDGDAVQVPKFLGHTMIWWANMARDRIMPWKKGDDPKPGNLLDHLGIQEAVLAWIRDEDAWEKRRSAARRKATREGRNWLGEMIPPIR